MWVRINSKNRSGSCSENCDFRIAQVVRCHSENGISHSENHFLNSESCSENALELSESSENGLFTPERFFPEIGVVRRLLKICFWGRYFFLQLGLVYLRSVFVAYGELAWSFLLTIGAKMITCRKIVLSN